MEKSKRKKVTWHDKAIAWVIEDERKKGRKAIILNTKQKKKYGCDIKSSSWRFIEVKTWKKRSPPPYIPIYSTQKNLNKLKVCHYCIYLFYDIKRNPKLIVIPQKRIKFHDKVMLYVLPECWRGLKSKSVTFKRH